MIMGWVVRGKSLLHIRNHYPSTSGAYRKRLPWWEGALESVALTLLQLREMPGNYNCLKS